MIKRSALFILTVLIIKQITCAEVWSKILDSPNYTALANTSIGLIAGEYDTRLSLDPYNGLIISKNLGSSWSSLGLQGRGITDIVSKDTIIFATTYFVKDGFAGLFSSNDNGNTWNSAGPSFSASSVAVDETTVYLGSYSHGLWVSFDSGRTFTQKVGTGFYGPTFLTVESNGIVAIAGTVGKTYKSTDRGETWQEITALAGKQAQHILFVENKIFIGTRDSDGIYLSQDSGVTWTKLTNFGVTPVGSLAFYNGSLYAGKYDSTLNAYSVFKSLDYGQTWMNTNLNVPSTNVLATNTDWMYSQPSFLVTALSSAGLYKMEITNVPIETFKFLNIPWETQQQTDLFDKIYSFFDHKYPLLAYSAYKEPPETRETTLNFLGKEAGEPELYYSSHSGVDFALPYGTEIKAPASGMAEFYNCNDCGYSIKIDHLNGYQTTYMHLQKDKLVTTSEKVPVFAGDIVGKVGLTGNTSGPHLHFEVTRDSNLNNIFTDDFPHGRVDPFGWLDVETKDPWDGHFWTDVFGQHTGQKSKYLWNAVIPQLEKLITPDEDQNEVLSGNKTFKLNGITSLLPYNFSYISYGEPRLSVEQSSLKYIPNTSFLLEIRDTLKNKITNLHGKVQIVIDFSLNDLSNIQIDSLKLYYYDQIQKMWVALNTLLDLTNNTLTAETKHLSQFAVFGTAADASPPVTIFNIFGNTSENWYTEFPTVTLTSTDVDLNKTFYSFGDDKWEEYSSPIKIQKDGVVKFSYRSSDTANNFETTNSVVIKINTLGKWTKTLKVRGVSFTTENASFYY